jgi:hypothetical protein
MPFKVKGKSAETIQGKIVAEYLSKYPDWFPIGSLARVIAKENPHTFDSAEAARNSIRYYLGKIGNKKRNAGNKALHENKERPFTSFAQPPTWTKEKEVFKFPVALKKAGFISDLQVPFHDPKAVQLAVDYLLEQDIDCLIINGDFVDFYGVSSFEKDPRQRKFKDEYDAILMELGYLRKSFPDIPIYYNLDANHEFRYERYMRSKAPELIGIDPFENLEDMLMLNKFNIISLKNYDHLKWGKLPIIHGDTVFKRGSGVNPAKYLFDKLRQSCIASHVHRTAEFTSKNKFDNEHFTCYTVGHLMHPNVEYCKHIDEYNQGFAILEKDQKGYYRVHNKRIINGMIF